MTFLNYHHLRYFWAISKHGSLRKAAEELNVSQPTISAQIKLLEEMIGGKLFTRGGRLTHTEVGRRVFSYADEIFSLGEDLLLSLKGKDATGAVRVQIGVTDSVPKLVAYEILKPVFSMGEPIEALFREGKTSELMSQLGSYRLDVVLSDEIAPKSFSSKVHNHFIGECGISFCAEANLAAVLKKKFPKSLNGAPALLPITNSALRRSLESWFKAEAIRPKLIAEFDDSALMTTMAVDGLGFLPIPSVVRDSLLNQYGLQTFGHTKMCRQEFYAVSLERKATHPAVSAITNNRESAFFSPRVA